MCIINLTSAFPSICRHSSLGRGSLGSSISGSCVILGKEEPPTTNVALLEVSVSATNGFITSTVQKIKRNLKTLNITLKMDAMINHQWKN
jgi:hypothetical protein